MWVTGWQLLVRRTVRKPVSRRCDSHALRMARQCGSGHAEDHQRHIIVLGSTCCERLCGSQDLPHDFCSRKRMTHFCQLDQPVFTPLFEAKVHGFGNSVGKQHDQVSGFMRKNTSLVAMWYKPDYRTSRLQA